MKNLNQKGSVHVVLVTCLVIALLFALGWIFWRNFVYKEPVKTNSQVVIIKPKVNSTPTSTSTQSDNGITLSQWGVKIKPSTTLPAVQYVAINRTASDGWDSVSYGFTTTRVQQLAGCEGASLVTVVRNTNYIPADAPGASGGSIAHVGKWYYYLTGSQQNCSQDGTDIQQSDMGAITQGLKASQFVAE